MKHVAIMPAHNEEAYIGRTLDSLVAQTERPDARHGGLQDQLADHADHIGSTMGPHAIPVIAEALSALGIETRTGVAVTAVDATGEIRPLEQIEADMIRLALGRYRGHMTEVAKRLNIGRSTLYRKMQEYGLEPRVN